MQIYLPDWARVMENRAGVFKLWKLRKRHFLIKNIPCPNCHRDETSVLTFERKHSSIWCLLTSYVIPGGGEQAEDDTAALELGDRRWVGWVSP